MLGLQEYRRQVQRWFFDGTKDRRFKHLPDPPTEVEIRTYLDSEECPLSEIIVSDENTGAIDTLRMFAFTALKRFNHSCRGLSFGIYAGAGQGKTFVVKQWSKVIGIPVVFLSSSAVDSTWTLFQAIRNAHEEYGTPLTMEEENCYRCPPTIVAFDEAHALKSKLMKGALLNAMEYSDHTLTTQEPGLRSTPVTVNCEHVCWVAMTTERGMLFDAFESRFETHITWAPAGPEEICDIVLMKMGQEYRRGDVTLEFPYEAAELVAKYQRVPRTALAFARKMIQHRDMNDGTWQEAALTVANNMRLNEYGMTEKEVDVLSALGQRPISKQNLCVVAKCRMEELERFVLPPLLAYDGEGPLVVPMSGRGCAVTLAGLHRLNRLGIHHRGERVTAEYIERRRA